MFCGICSIENGSDQNSTASHFDGNGIFVVSGLGCKKEAFCRSEFGVVLNWDGTVDEE